MRTKINIEDYPGKRPLRLHTRNWAEDGEGVVITVPSGRMFWLNESGAFIWGLCDGKYTIEEIVDAMIKRYEDLERNTAIKDLLKLVLSLQKLGVVRLL